jgi:hypothetical protein
VRHKNTKQPIVPKSTPSELFPISWAFSASFFLRMWTRTAPLAIVQRQSIKMWHLSNRKWQTHNPRNINNAQAGAEHRFRLWWRINKTQKLLTAASLYSLCVLFLFNYPATGARTLCGGPPRIKLHGISLKRGPLLCSRTVRTPLSGAKLFQRLLCQQQEQGVLRSMRLQSWPTWEWERKALQWHFVLLLS